MTLIVIILKTLSPSKSSFVPQLDVELATHSFDIKCYVSTGLVLWSSQLDGFLL